MSPHAKAIQALPPATRALVLDALRVRAMDFVADRLESGPDYSDEAADVYRKLVPDADKRNAFDPERFEVTS